MADRRRHYSDDDLRLYATLVSRGGFGLGFDEARLGEEWRELPPARSGLQIDFEYGRTCALELRAQGLPLDAWAAIESNPRHPLFGGVIDWMVSAISFDPGHQQVDNSRRRR